MWLIFGICSLILTSINIFLGIKKHAYTKWATVSALTFMALTILSQYYMVKNWVLLKDWSALFDVVPFMTNALTIYILILSFINAAVLWQASRK